MFIVVGCIHNAKPYSVKFLATASTVSMKSTSRYCQQRAHVCFCRRRLAKGIRHRHLTTARAARLAAWTERPRGRHGGNRGLIATSLQCIGSGQAGSTHGQWTTDTQPAGSKDRHGRLPVGRQATYARPAECRPRTSCRYLPTTRLSALACQSRYWRPAPAYN